ncbi:MAG: OmpA family protein [Candidatus Binataceae bacterium]
MRAMKRHRLIFNWAASAVLGGLLVSLLQMSACSRSIQPLPPLTSTSRLASADTSIEKVELRRGVQFRRDGSILPDSKPVLDSALELLKKKPNATIYVDAYCDPTGGQKLNQQPSEQRAAAVASYLQKHGIPDHVVPRGFGASHFVANNTTISGRFQNRRIELIVQRDAG